MVNYEQIKSIKSYEPRIRAIQSQINNLLKVVDFEYNGEKVEVNGFKLKKLDHWIIKDLRASEKLVAQLAHCCDSDCQFCYHKGNPPDFALGKKDEFVTPLEMDTRIKYFDPASGTSLFSSNYEQKEVLYDPNTIKYLKIIREKSKDLITINTNGLGLTKETIKELKQLEPVILFFSINSIDQEKRDAIMKNSKANSSIHILKMLNEYSLPFIASVAMWPSIETNDIENLIRRVSEFNPYFIRLIMPGYTDYFSINQEWDFEEHFSMCVDKILTLRKELDTPLVVYPEAYIHNKYKLFNQPYLTGVIKGSPLHCSGLKAGDVLKTVNGIGIKNRAQAKSILLILEDYGNNFNIEYERQGSTYTADIDVNYCNYPFRKGLTRAPLGAILSGGLKESYITQLEQLINSNNAHKVLFMTSKLMRDNTNDLFNKMEIPLKNENREIILCTPENYYLGGNIIIGDMLTVKDYIIAAQEEIEKQPIDLIVVPSSAFYGSDGWQRDLSGRYYKEIEWETGIKTCLLNCECFTY